MVNFDFGTDYILEDKVVKLQPLVEGDFNRLLTFSLNEPDIWKYSTIGADGEERLKSYINAAMKGRMAEKEYPFIVFDKRVEKYVGSTRFYEIQLKNKTLLLGYTWYGKEYQGTGINKHCKYLLLRFAFEQMGMMRVEFRANLKNERSINAMKGIGCTVEGVLRSNLATLNGERRDSIVLSILQEEWRNEIKSKLANRLIQESNLNQNKNIK